MASPVLRIIFGDVSDSRKMHLDSGIPATVSEFHMLVKTFFDLTEDFRLQYMDTDFNAFMNLTSMSDVKDKGTLKVIYNPNPTPEEEFITLYPVETSTDTSVNSCQASSPGPSLVSFCSDDTPCTSTPTSSEETQLSGLSPWPNVFVVPKFTYDAELELQQKNAEYEANGALFRPGIKLKGIILDGLAQEMLKYTKYPKDYQCEEVAAALTKTHPCLGQLGSKTGFWGWKQSLKYKMQNYRTKLGRLGDPEILVNSLKHKREGHGKTAANIKKPRKAEANYVPLPPKGESTESLENERVALLSEIKKRDNEAVIKAKMERTFSHRRLEIVEQRPMIKDFMNRWPAFFKESEVNAEFLRITTKPLQAKFLYQLDNLSNKLMQVFDSIKGTKGQKIKNVMAISNLCDDIDTKREHILKSLVIYFNEDPDLLFKEYLTTTTEDERLRCIAATVMGIYTIRREGIQQPEDVGVVIEGTAVMNNLGSVILAFIVLFGLIYGLDLSYPNDYKYTFEFCQKIIMDLDGQRLSAKMQQMKIKLFA